MEYLLIGLGGFLGANARYLTATWMAELLGSQLPYGTFVANISGSFFLGFVLAVLQNHGLLDSAYRLFFAIGFLGAYTTFSTYIYESLQLLQQGVILSSLAYLLGSIVIGLLAACVGLLLGRFV